MDAHMYIIPDGKSSPQLLLTNHGNFDTFSFVDESTGVSTSVIDDLAGDFVTSPAFFACLEATKDCDMWQTSAYDPVSKTVFYQAHPIDDQSTSAIYGMTFINNSRDTWFAVANQQIWPFQFGYAAFQFANFA